MRGALGRGMCQWDHKGRHLEHPWEDHTITIRLDSAAETHLVDPSLLGNTLATDAPSIRRVLELNQKLPGRTVGLQYSARKFRTGNARRAHSDKCGLGGTPLSERFSNCRIRRRTL